MQAHIFDDNQYEQPENRLACSLSASSSIRVWRSAARLLDSAVHVPLVADISGFIVARSLLSYESSFLR
jgi:hypothetical protein